MMIDLTIEERPSIPEYFMMMAILVASRATCSRRKVGAVAVDRNGYVLSTGYNGVPKGRSHCIESACAGSSFGSGEGLNECQAIHAEINAITHCANPQKIYSMFVTTSPCMSCMKAIVATGCRLIFTLEIYDEDAIEYFESVGGVVKIEMPAQIK